MCLFKDIEHEFIKRILTTDFGLKNYILNLRGTGIISFSFCLFKKIHNLDKGRNLLKIFVCILYKGNS